MTTLRIDQYVSRKSTFHDAPDTVYPKRVTPGMLPVDVTASSQQSATVDSSTSFVSIRPVGGAVYVEIGANPTATVTSKWLDDGDIYDEDVNPGDKIAVIEA